MKILTKKDNGHIQVKTMNSIPSKTQQHLKDSTDINLIMERYKKRPDPSIFKKSGKGVYGDFSQVTNFQEAVIQAQSATEAFQSLPAKVRAKFQNNPQELLNFINDPNNLNEAIEIGLIEKPKKIIIEPNQLPPKNTDPVIPPKEV